MFINLSSSDKKLRAGQIATSLGSGANALFYTGTAPASPDLTATGTLLATLPLSSVACTAYTVVASASVNTGGTGGTSGTQTVSGTTGSGTPFTASVTVAGGAITAVLSVTPGQYTVSPSNPNGEPVTGAGLVGATLTLVLTAACVFAAITAGTAVASGTAGYCRMATSGGLGVVDLDVGTSGAAMIITSVAVVSGGSVSITSASFTEQ